MPASARLETILGRLKLGQPLVGETFTDNHVKSDYFGKNYTVSDIVVSPKSRICLQVTYDCGERSPRLLDISSEDIHIPKQPLKPAAELLQNYPVQAGNVPERKPRHNYSPGPRPIHSEFT